MTKWLPFWSICLCALIHCHDPNAVNPKLRKVINKAAQDMVHTVQEHLCNENVCEQVPAPKCEDVKDGRSSGDSSGKRRESIEEPDSDSIEKFDKVVNIVGRSWRECLPQESPNQENGEDCKSNPVHSCIVRCLDPQFQQELSESVNKTKSDNTRPVGDSLEEQKNPEIHGDEGDKGSTESNDVHKEQCEYESPNKKGVEPEEKADEESGSKECEDTVESSPPKKKSSEDADHLGNVDGSDDNCQDEDPNEPSPKSGNGDKDEPEEDSNEKDSDDCNVSDPKLPPTEKDSDEDNGDDEKPDQHLESSDKDHVDSNNPTSDDDSDSCEEAPENDLNNAKESDDSKKPNNEDECEDDANETANSNKDSKDDPKEDRSDEPDLVSKSEGKDDDCEDELKPKPSKESSRNPDGEDDCDEEELSKSKKDDKDRESAPNLSDSQQGKGENPGDDHNDSSDSGYDSDQQEGSPNDKSDPGSGKNENNLENDTTEDEDSTHINLGDNKLLDKNSDKPGPSQLKDEGKPDENQWLKKTNQQSGITLKWKPETDAERNNRDNSFKHTGVGNYQTIVDKNPKNIIVHVPDNRLNEALGVISDDGNTKNFEKLTNYVPSNPPLYLNAEKGIGLNRDALVPNAFKRVEYDDHNGQMLVYVPETNAPYIWKANDVGEYGKILKQPEYKLDIPTGDKQVSRSPFTISRSQEGIKLEKPVGATCPGLNELKNPNLIVKNNMIKGRYKGDRKNRFAEIPLSQNSTNLLARLGSDVPELGIKVHNQSRPDEWNYLVRKNAFLSLPRPKGDLTLSYRKRTEEEKDVQFSTDGRVGKGGSSEYEVVMNENPEKCAFIRDGTLLKVKNKFQSAHAWENEASHKLPAFVDVSGRLIFTDKLMGDLRPFPMEFDPKKSNILFLGFNGNRYMYRSGDRPYEVFDRVLKQVQNTGYALLIRDRMWIPNSLSITNMSSVGNGGNSSIEYRFDVPGVDGEMPSEIDILENPRINSREKKLTLNYKKKPQKEVVVQLSSETYEFLHFLNRAGILKIIFI